MFKWICSLFKVSPKAKEKTFCEDYKERLTQGILSSEIEINLLQADADSLATEVMDLINQRLKVLENRQSLIELVNKQRVSLGLPFVDYSNEEVNEVVDPSADEVGEMNDKV
ncbi:hypothetical protein [Yersinia phage vB_YenM_P778]